MIDQFDNKYLINHDIIKNYKKYFLADPAYDTKIIRKKLKNDNYIPIIVQNIRNIKDETKIIKLSPKEKKIYNKRLVIERTFNIMKMNRKICLRYESKIINFIGFVFLSLIKMII